MKNIIYVRSLLENLIVLGSNASSKEVLLYFLYQNQVTTMNEWELRGDTAPSVVYKLSSTSPWEKKAAGDQLIPQVERIIADERILRPIKP